MGSKQLLNTIDILLVEDNPSDVRLAELALEESKIKNRFMAVEDGEEALSFLRREGGYAQAFRPDLILLDLNLPKLSGQEVLIEIRNDPELTTIPVVILSSSEAETDILKSYELHANAYVSKPIELDRFFEVVRAIEGFWFTIVKLPTKVARRGSS